MECNNSCLVTPSIPIVTECTTAATPLVTTIQTVCIATANAVPFAIDCEPKGSAGR